jgi:hypothetical protein
MCQLHLDSGRRFVAASLPGQCKHRLPHRTTLGSALTRGVRSYEAGSSNLATLALVDHASVSPVAAGSL